MPPGGCGISSSVQSTFQRSRSSAASIASGDVPATSSAGIWPASFSGVCPPSETMIRYGCSAAITLSTSSRVSGSKYNRSLVS